MNDALGTHDDEGRDNLAQERERGLGRDVLILLDELRQVSSFAVLHDDSQLLLLVVEVVLVYLE